MLKFWISQFTRITRLRKKNSMKKKNKYRQNNYFPFILDFEHQISNLISRNINPIVFTLKNLKIKKIKL